MSFFQNFPFSKKFLQARIVLSSAAGFVFHVLISIMPFAPGRNESPICGKKILQRSGSESFSISAIRLCVLMMPNSVVSGKRGILTTLCESQLFIDGPRNRAAILLSLSRSHNRNPRFGGSIWTIRPVLIFFFHCESAASNSLTSSPPIPAVMKETSLTYSRLLSSNSS